MFVVFAYEDVELLVCRLSSVQYPRVANVASNQIVLILQKYGGRITFFSGQSIQKMPKCEGPIEKVRNYIFHGGGSCFVRGRRPKRVNSRGQSRRGREEDAEVHLRRWTYYLNDGRIVSFTGRHVETGPKWKRPIEKV